MTPREHAISLYNQALPLIPTDPPLAYQMLTSAVVTDPTFAVGWAYLGAALADLGKILASIEAYRTALRQPDGEGPGDMTPEMRHRCLLQLGHRLTNNEVVSWERIEEAESLLCEALGMDFDTPKQEQAFCHTNMSICAAHLGNTVDEIDYAEMGFRIYPDPATELGLAFACLFQGRYADGLKHFEARFPHKLGSYLSLPWPRWDGGLIDHLVVLSEQGLGDALSFARFIPAAAALVRTLTYSVQPELLRLLSDGLAHVPNVRVVPQDRVMEHADAWCPVFSLPTALGLTDEQIRDASWPLIPVKPVEDTSWKRRDARLHVAIAWAGATANGIDMHRSIPFTEFLALRAVPGVALYSVQVGDRAQEMHNGGCGAFVRDMAPWVRDARDTAGILGEMDLVITCESFVGHLAGAIGKRCFLLCSRFGRDWRSSPYLGDRVLWYPETTVFRQGDDAQWGPVFKRVVEALSDG